MSLTPALSNIALKLEWFQMNKALELLPTDQPFLLTGSAAADHLQVADVIRNSPWQERNEISTPALTPSLISQSRKTFYKILFSLIDGTFCFVPSKTACLKNYMHPIRPYESAA